jgi:outer membrane receptor protein involved in Fe transport
LKGRRVFHGAAAGILALVLAIGATAARAAETEKPIWFDIPAEPLAAALTEYSRQAHVSIGTSTHISGLKSKAVRGFLTPENALARLLRETGLDHRFLAPDAALVAQRQAAPVEAPPATRKASTPVPGEPVIDNLVVTASKAASRAQALPAAVSVIGGAGLEDLGVARTGQMTSEISGLMMTNMGPGRSKLFIRGLSDGAFTGQTRSTVGVYLDDAPMTFNDPYPDIRLVDIDRIEVLRGPQGTLYGTGALSGIFRVIPNAPDLQDPSGEMAASSSVTKNGGWNKAVEGYLNLPLKKDVLGIRVAGSAEHDDGYIDDLRLDRSNVNSSKIGAVRGILAWQPASEWTLDLMGSVQNIKLADSQYFVRDLGRYNRDDYLAEPYSDFFKLANAKLSGPIGSLDLLSSTTLIRRENRARNDATLSVPLYVDLPAVPSPFDTKRDIDDFSQETRLSSQGRGRLDWLVGIFYLRRHETTGLALTVPGAAAADPSLPEGRVFSQRRDDHVREMALFSNASLDLGGGWRFGAGARLSRLKYDTAASFFGLPENRSSSNGHVEGINAHTSLTPQATLSYRPGNGTMVYGSFLAGYRNGGVNVNTPIEAITDRDSDASGSEIRAFRPDRLWNFEIGAKEEWLDHRLRLNASVFYVIWRNIQTDQYLPDGLPYVVNAGDAHNYGVEVEMTALVTGNLEIAGNVFWNSPELSEANSFLGAEKGDRLPGIAEFSGGGSATYRFRLGGFDGTLSGRYAYMGKSYLMFEEGSPSMGNYSTADIRLEIGRNPWTLGAFIQNSWSETGNSFSFGNPFSRGFENQITPLQPLTIGLTARISY